ncbi:haloacid dehalogenase type II [Marinimicrococcus flavescens]|uniref:(S)-2-haloacid dehalogenase n=1 Tax=Marinimicrococcus flavescens TaxID=3031815 RepID=A0AAP3XR31_9PROT|nr:haloacid dehalogenase type II [Marinimicrococcus flavescens]
MRLTAGACVFDAYGTLLDLASAIAPCQDVLGEKAQAVGELWRRRQLEYSWLRSLMGRHRDFEGLTADALDYALEAHGVADPAIRDRLLGAYRGLRPYPEVATVLRTLREGGLRCLVLSNGTPDMLAAGFESAGLEELLDGVLSVEQAGLFKPSPEVYRLAVGQLGLPPGEIVFVSSNGWDAHGAACFGFQTVWVNRGGAPPERLPGQLAFTLEDLSGLPALLGLASPSP